MPKRERFVEFYCREELYVGLPPRCFVKWRRGSRSTIYRSFKRSLSEGNMVCESTTDSSSNVEEGNSQNVHLPIDAKKEGLSEFTPEIPTCGRDTSYSRQLFADSEHDYFHQIRFDELSSSNFLDLDHISSSGNSCAEEIYERQLLVCRILILANFLRDLCIGSTMEELYATDLNF